jgi:hypothetical protein
MTERRMRGNIYRLLPIQSISLLPISLNKTSFSTLLTSFYAYYYSPASSVNLWLESNRLQISLLEFELEQSRGCLPLERVSAGHFRHTPGLHGPGGRIDGWVEGAIGVAAVHGLGAVHLKRGNKRTKQMENRARSPAIREVRERKQCSTHTTCAHIHNNIQM